MTRKRFEYQVYKHFIEETEQKEWNSDDDGLGEALDLLGQQGWSLVSTTPVLVQGGEVKILLCVSKRELAD